LQDAKVTRIAIGRLHNLGNYEHIRYDVTVELSNGENAGLVISRLEKLLAALKPIEKNDYDYQRAVKVMSDPELAKDESVRNIEIYKARIEKREKAVARRARALELFSELGGTSEHVDAKDKWEDDDYWDDNDW
jgi:hypothetical protein